MSTNHHPTVLEDADRVTSQDRNNTYGHPADNLGDTAHMWSRYLSRSKGAPVTIDPADVAWMMVLLKICREAHFPARDNKVDVCGWVRTIEMIEEREKQGAAGV